MNKIICEVCGSAYPETAERCPICGCIRNNAMPPITTTNANPTEERKYQHTPGGRFSKSNVRRRNQGKSSSSAPKMNPEYIKYIAVGIALFLLFAILLGLIISSCGRNNGESVPPITTHPTTEPTTEATVTTEDGPVGIPCVSVVFKDQKVKLTELKAEPFQLTAICTPTNTTDIVYFRSSDEAVLTVAEDGKITAISNGTATITVTCGTQTATCEVTVDDPNASKPPVTPTGTYHLKTQYKNYAEGVVKLDVSLKLNGGSADKILYLYVCDEENNKMTVEWTASKSDIVSISGNKITAVGKGNVTVSTEFEGITYSCIVRVN